MEYTVKQGKYRGKDVWEVRRGSENTGIVLESYKTREAAEELVSTLTSLTEQKARD